MVLKINPAKIPLWRNPQTLQLGLGKDALVLEQVSSSDEKLINLLYRGVADASLNTLAVNLGSPQVETDALISRLSPALVSSPEEAIRSAALRDEFIEQAFAEIIRASFASGIDGRSIIAARTTRMVSLRSGDKSALVVALALAAAGLGAVSCDDDSPVTMQDVGPLGYEMSELGCPRRDALARRLERGSHPCRLIRPTAKHFGPALQLHTSMHMTPNHEYRDALRGSTPHLALEFGIGSTTITPLVQPGTTPCLSCRQSSESENDEHWATITTQLQFRNDRLDDTQSTLLATGFALEQILQYVDDPRGTGFEGTRLDHHTGQVERLTWLVDKSCECQSLVARR